MNVEILRISLIKRPNRGVTALNIVFINQIRRICTAIFHFPFSIFNSQPRLNLNRR